MTDSATSNGGSNAIESSTKSSNESLASDTSDSMPVDIDDSLLPSAQQPEPRLPRSSSPDSRNSISSHSSSASSDHVKSDSLYEELFANNFQRPPIEITPMNDGAQNDTSADAVVTEAMPFDVQTLRDHLPNFSKHDLSMLNLISECDKAGAPKGFFDKIVALIRKESTKNEFDISKAQTRETFMTHLHKMFPSSKPRVEKVVVNDRHGQPTSHHLQVMVFSFLDQLTDLLADPEIFADPSNLCINEMEEAFYSQFSPEEKDQFNEVMGADWYRRTYEQLITDPTSEILIPLILYADRTGTDAYQRYSLEPWMFTLALLRRHIRERSTSWRHLGFIPEVDAKSTGTKLSAESKAQLYHDCLGKILEEIIYYQRNPPIQEVRFGSVTRSLKLKLSVAFIIGDQKSNDLLCGRKPVSKGAGRIHRGCMTSFSNASKPEHICQWVKRETILKLTTIALSPKDEAFMASFNQQFPNERGGKEGEQGP
jgi:hypothetical protein